MPKNEIVDKNTKMSYNYSAVPKTVSLKNEFSEGVIGYEQQEEKEEKMDKDKA